MFDGRMVQFGTPEDIFNRPRNRRVADFMGATNLIPGRLTTVDRDVSLLESTVGSLRVASAPHHRPRAEVVATVRPEHVDLSAATAAAAPNCFPARVEEAVYYGGTLTYRVASAGMVLQVRDRSTRRFPVGEEVMVSIDPDHLWVFPD
jgi:ABC-type Fe3+/spermidine/putrescine transport system ATPase subunit